MACSRINFTFTFTTASLIKVCSKLCYYFCLTSLYLKEVKTLLYLTWLYIEVVKITLSSFRTCGRGGGGEKGDGGGEDIKQEDP